jgi:phosphoribosylanthranilate isomerase
MQNRRSLPSPFPYPFVKICGFTAVDAAMLAAAEAGAHAVGINFYAKSKRAVLLADAIRWLDDVPPSLNRVAILKDHSSVEVRAIWDSGKIDTLQFHGEESDEFVLTFVGQGIPVFRALPLNSVADIPRILACPVETIVLDAGRGAGFGGRGELCDWDAAAQLIAQCPNKRFLLSGGLHPENVAAGITQTHPAGVDVASGAEIEGKKDAGRIRSFILAAKTAQM